jgi:hypothetical protein
MMADRTCHVIAPRYFLYEPLTLFAFLNVRSILPPFYLLLEGPLTTRPWVRLSIALVADLNTALRAFTGFLFRVGTDHHRALGVGAPF